MKKHLLILFALLALPCLAQEELLTNGAFDAQNFRAELFTDFAKDTWKLSLFTEEYNWNRCLKAELAQFTETEGKRRLNVALYFGRSGNQPGFKVKPNSVYQFSFEAKGTAPRASAKAVTFKGAGTSIWSEGRENATTSLGSFPIEKEWKTYRGTFKTGANAERASLIISLWGDEAQEKNFAWKVGDYILVDNIRVTEKPSVVELGPKARRKIVDTKDYICMPSTFDTFINATSGASANGMYSVEASLDANAVKLVVTCKADTPIKATVKDNGSKIWADDVVEVFFGPTAKSDRTLSQFVLGAGGGRYIGNGNSQLDDYASWQAVPQVMEKGWTATFTIPFKMLGYDAKPTPGESILFNVSAQHDRQLYSWAHVRGNFHDTEKYNVMVFGTPKEFATHLLADLKECPEEFVSKKNEIAKGELSPHDLNVAVLELKEDIKNYRLGNEKFLLGTLPVTGDYTLPLDVGLENVLLPPVKPILLTGAVNETLSLPLTITNRTEETAAYRVILHPNIAPVQVETLGLDNGFPRENITMMEGVPMKDGDSFGAGLRFDALPKMNQAFTITVPAGQTGLVWLRIDCRGVEPKSYTGAIRVVPLSLPADIVVHSYKGPMRDYKLCLNVLPITLDIDNPDIPTWLMERGTNEDFFKLQTDLLGRYLLINPWMFKFKFDDKGNLVDGDLPDAVEYIRKRLQWFDQYNRHNGCLFMVHFGCYDVFEKNYMNKKIKLMTPEWEKCWRNDLLAIQEIFRKAGVKEDEWGIEVFDEPNGKNLERDLEVTRIARETLPKTMLSITWAAPNFGHTPDTIRKFNKYLDNNCFWASHLGTPAYRELLKELTAKGIDYGIYYCSTSMRESLYRYYRLHAWKNWECGGKHIGLYVLCNAPHGTSGVRDWKACTSGGICYRSGDEAVSSVRLEAFRTGLMDSAYLSVLKKLANAGSTPLHQEAQKFLKEAPRQAVITSPHDTKTADKLRAKAIDLILKLSK